MEVCLCGSPPCLTGHGSSHLKSPLRPRAHSEPRPAAVPALLKSNLRACLSPGLAPIVPDPTHTKQMSGTPAGFSRRKL